MKTGIAIALFCVLVLCGCATVPEPEPEITPRPVAAATKPSPKLDPARRRELNERVRRKALEAEAQKLYEDGLAAYRQKRYRDACDKLMKALKVLEIAE